MRTAPRSCAHKAQEHIRHVNQSGAGVGRGGQADSKSRAAAHFDSFPPVAGAAERRATVYTAWLCLASAPPPPVYWKYGCLPSGGLELLWETGHKGLWALQCNRASLLPPACPGQLVGSR
ncbi:unnamed protein product [Lota lota]